MRIRKFCFDTKRLRKDREIILADSFTQYLGKFIIQCENMNLSFIRRIKKSKVKETRKEENENENVVGPNVIHIKIWRYL